MVGDLQSIIRHKIYYDILFSAHRRLRQVRDVHLRLSSLVGFTSSACCLQHSSSLVGCILRFVGDLLYLLFLVTVFFWAYSFNFD